MSTEPTFLEREYTELNANFRLLSDVRFKLLALVPILGGIAVFVLSNIGLSANSSAAAGAQASQAVAPAQDWLLALLGSIFGFLVSLGIVIYDQRNSELYNALIHRAKYIEKLNDLPTAPGGLKVSAGKKRPEGKNAEMGGQFSERPLKRRRFGPILAGHDLALAFIYGPLLGAWFFPGVYSAMLLWDPSQKDARSTAVIVVGIAVALAIGWLSWLDKQDSAAYNIANVENPGNAAALAAARAKTEARGEEDTSLQERPVSA
ncbi:MAG: hypothetical protein GEV13_17150 [Rhodospirillales bacterium]|nr:hypothetical protein [Rhodospirillales bacterium]